MRRQFREVAGAAGLIFQGYPGSNKSVKQVQASSGLLSDGFARHDPENLLLFQGTAGFLVDRARAQVSSEKFLDRVRRLAAPLERAAETKQSSRAAAGRGAIRQLRSLTPRDCLGR